MKIHLPEQNNRNVLFEILRIYVGIFLLMKGVTYAGNLSELFKMTSSAMPFAGAIVAHYVIGAHLVGGAMLATGLLTRFAAVMNMPILIGAMLFVHWGEGFMGPNFTTALAMFMFLSIITWKGSGLWSLDHRWVLRNPDEDRETFFRTGKSTRKQPRVKAA